jgi:hypothetical protein
VQQCQVLGLGSVRAAPSKLFNLNSIWTIQRQLAWLSCNAQITYATEENSVPGWQDMWYHTSADQVLCMFIVAVLFLPADVQ